MLRASTKILIKTMFKAGKINEERKKTCLRWISNDKTHKEIRNLIAMILLPKKLHKNDESQAAYLKAAVSRIANPTVLEKPGALMLYPIYHLLFGKHNDGYWLG